MPVNDADGAELPSMIPATKSWGLVTFPRSLLIRT